VMFLSLGHHLANSVSSQLQTSFSVRFLLYIS
jgi:hypothetical protein